MSEETYFSRDNTIHPKLKPILFAQSSQVQEAFWLLTSDKGSLDQVIVYPKGSISFLEGT